MSELVLCENRILMCALGCWSLAFGSSPRLLDFCHLVKNFGAAAGNTLPIQAKMTRSKETISSLVISQGCVETWLFKLSNDVQCS